MLSALGVGANLTSALPCGRGGLSLIILDTRRCRSCCDKSYNFINGFHEPFFAVEFKHPSWFTGEVYDAIAASARLSLVSCHGYGPGSELAPDAWYPRDHADALRCAHGKCFYTRLHGTIGESQGDYGEHHLLPLCDRLRQHSAGGGGLSFVGLNNVGGDPPSAVVDAATIAARLNGP